MKIEVTYPDPVWLSVLYIRERFADLGLTYVVDKRLDDDFNPAAASQEPHIEVKLDGTPRMDHPIAAHHTIRLVAWARTNQSGQAATAVLAALGVLAAHPGGGGIASTEAQTGPLPARDPSNKAELCAVTLRVTVRSQPLEPSGS